MKEDEQKSMDSEEEKEEGSEPILWTPDEFVPYLNRQLEKGKLSYRDFREYWRRVVPLILRPSFSEVYHRPESSIEDEDEEDEVKGFLINTLESFLCEGGVPSEVFETLSNQEDPPAQCGKRFKMGDPTYSCRDCGIDANCVFCVDCFKNSDHRNHRYKMRTSSGGGYCDCGDVQAWSNEPYCQIHSLGAGITNVDPLSKLPIEIRVRAKYIFESVLQYVYDILTLDSVLALPSDLLFKNSHDLEDDPLNDDLVATNDLYATLVYNDEFHTFDEVITTLPRAVDCDKNTAINYATLIHREGRCLVKCSGFQSCNEVKKIAERITSRRGSRPLRVVIMHSHVFAHQTFALRLLSWIQNILDYSVGFKAIFSSVMLDRSSKRSSLLESVCRHDTILWKRARSLIHHLLISGMLFNDESRLQFAQTFAKCYGNMMKDFIYDDHEYTFSIMSLGLQIFSMPSLAHHLIAHDDVLSNLLLTFMSECERKRNARGKIEFQGNHNITGFRRAHYILSDIKYLLTTPPENWSDNLKRGFLHGLDNLLVILSWIQGMDSQKRQVNSHVEFELQWNTAFHLQMKFTPIFSSIYAWAATDRIVLIKSIRLVFKTLREFEKEKKTKDSMIPCTILDKTYDVIDYQVSSKSISIHFPVTRLLAGLCLCMDKFDLDYDSSVFQIPAKPDPVTMIELPVRTMAYVAQVQAGMWRRNGNSLIDQLHAYKNSHCRKEMLDHDIRMLQWGATLLNPDHFIINFVNKYQLLNWTSSDFDCSEDDGFHQTICLVEDLFGTLIIIMGERYTPGVGDITPTEALKREIIQFLCVEPMTFSAINKSILDDLNRESALEKIIESVATFKRPNSTTGKGCFELKPEFYTEYNVFFYHYTREDQSKSEEAQRARKKANGEPQCNPPPRPPSFAKFFAKAADVLRSDTLIYLMSLVAERADNLKSRCFSESQVHKVLHLICLSLYEQERYAEAKSIPESEFFTNRAEKFKLLSLLEQLVGNQRIASHKDLLNWTIKFWKKCVGEDEQAPQSSGSNDVSVGDDSSGCKEEEDAQKLKRAEMAKARRLKLMAQMKSAQTKFMKENAEFIQDATSSSSSKQAASEGDTSMDVDEPSSPVCLGFGRSQPVPTETSFTCILCQEDEVLTREGAYLVMATFVQKSTVLWKRRKPRLNSTTNVYATEFREQQHKFNNFPLLPSDLACAPHISSCGHVMHAPCWHKYYEDVVSHERQRSRTRHFSFDIEKGEFLCPLCRCINNAIIPLVPQYHLLQSSASDTLINLEFADWVRAMEIVLKYKQELCPFKLSGKENEDSIVVTRYSTCPLDYVLQELSEESAKSFALLYAQKERSKLRIPSSTFDMKLFCETVNQIGFDFPPKKYDEQILLTVWQSCAYTIHASVTTLVDQGKSLFGATSSRLTDCLSSLVRVGGVVGTRQGENVVIKSHVLKLLSILLDDADPQNLSIMDFDAFGVLVALTFSLPSLFNIDQEANLPSADAQDLNILRLLFLVHTVQILLTTDRFSFSNQETPSSPGTPILKLLRIVREAVGFASDADGLEGLTEEGVTKDLKMASLPFLRCSALFYFHLSGVPASVELKEHISNPLIEYERLSNYLGLPANPKDLFNSDTVYSLAVKWAMHPGVRHSLSASSYQAPIYYPMQINQLVELPKDYSELINLVSSFTCPKSIYDDSRFPAMCLICGVVLCSQSYCCQTSIDSVPVGACTAHAHKCSAGNGIFLRVRECKIVLISGRFRGFYIPPPYIDQYGETDMGLRRGNPLTLCPRRYKKICNLWLSHGIPEEISYNIETNQLLANTPWQHL